MGKLRIVVVGAGITGLSIAINLLRRGFSVTVVDERFPPVGASRAANGAITPYSDETLRPEVQALAEETLREFPGFIDWLASVSGQAVHYDAGGVLQILLPADEERIERYEAFAGSRNEVNWLSPQEALRLAPNVSPRIIGAVHYYSETRVDVHQLLDVMFDVFARCGGSCSVPTKVIAVRRTSQGLAEIVTPLGSSYFDYAVVAVGGGGVEVSRLPSFKVSRVRGEILELHTAPGSIQQCLYRGDAFLTPRRDGRLLAGTTYHLHEPGMNECLDTIDVDAATTILSAMREILPDSGRYQLSRVWKGWRPTSGDGNPVVGQVDDSPVWIADGLAGLGYTLSIALASRISESISSGNVASDLQSFSPYRFPVPSGTDPSDESGSMRFER